MLALRDEIVAQRQGICARADAPMPFFALNPLGVLTPLGVLCALSAFGSLPIGSKIPPARLNALGAGQQLERPLVQGKAPRHGEFEGFTQQPGRM